MTHMRYETGITNMGDERNNVPMSGEKRAKQFMPFAALKGYEEELKKQETRFELRKELSEEYMEEVNRSLGQIHKGDRITVTYFEGGEYKEATGTVTAFYQERGFFRISDKEIFFHNIYSIGWGV